MLTSKHLWVTAQRNKRKGALWSHTVTGGGNFHQQCCCRVTKELVVRACAPHHMSPSLTADVPSARQRKHAKVSNLLFTRHSQTVGQRTLRTHPQQHLNCCVVPCRKIAAQIYSARRRTFGLQPTSWKTVSYELHRHIFFSAF